jgi:hypothetical protein
MKVATEKRTDEPGMHDEPPQRDVQEIDDQGGGSMKGRYAVFERSLMKHWAPHHYQENGDIVERNFLQLEIAYRLSKEANVQGEVTLKRMVHEMHKLTKGAA